MYLELFYFRGVRRGIKIVNTVYEIFFFFNSICLRDSINFLFRKLKINRKWKKVNGYEVVF